MTKGTLGKIATVATFAGAASLCVVVSASYPVAVWAVGYGVLHRNSLAKQVAATKES